MPVEALVARARAGDQRALARLATRVEHGGAEATEVSAALAGIPSQARVVGITGPPGAGKSSLLSSLASRLSAAGKSVAIIAVDPTSPVTGGAALGDRIRMTDAALLPGVFVRSLASRTRPDGLAPAVQGMIRLFDAAEFDYVFLETVGSGQNQVAVAGLVHTVVLVEGPGAGDSVQMLKAGIMEMADIFAVTKGDLPGARIVSREMRSMVMLSDREDGWKPPVVTTSAETGSGIEELVAAIDKHATWLRVAETDRLQQRSRTMARGAIRGALVERAETILEDDSVNQLIDEVAAGTINPTDAAEKLIRRAQTDLALD